jgi:hypothetical protein
MRWHNVQLEAHSCFLSLQVLSCLTSFAQLARSPSFVAHWHNPVAVLCSWKRRPGCVVYRPRSCSVVVLPLSMLLLLLLLLIRCMRL